MRNYAALIMVALVLALTVPAQALTNGSFESGLTGWGSQINGGGIGTTTQHHAVGSGDGRVYNPTDGNRFALLRAGDAGRWVRIAQQFNVASPGILSFDWFFDSDESDVYISQGYNDEGSGWINTNTLFSIKASDLPGDGSTPWMSESVAVNPGNYRVTFGVKNVRDALQDSYLGVDNVSWGSRNGNGNGNGVIPEPMTMMAVACGIGGLGGYLRKRRTA